MIMLFLSRQPKYESRAAQHFRRSSRVGAGGAPSGRAVAVEDEAVEEDEPNPNTIFDGRASDVQVARKNRPLYNRTERQ